MCASYFVDIKAVAPSWVVPTLISVAVGALFYWLGRRDRSRSRMAFQKSNYLVISETQATKNLGRIRILFNDLPVPRIVVTKLAVWNTGNTMVDGKDLATSVPLEFSVEAGASILDAQRVKANNEANNFHIRVSNDRSRAFLEFDFLNQGDGAIFQITHTGDQNAPKLAGTIKGVAKGVEDWGTLSEWDASPSKNPFPAPYFFLFVILVWFLIWLKGRLTPRYPILDTIANWLGGGFVILMLVMFLLAGCVVLYEKISSHTRKPKSLFRR